MEQYVMTWWDRTYRENPTKAVMPLMQGSCPEQLPAMCQARLGKLRICVHTQLTVTRVKCTEPWKHEAFHIDFKSFFEKLGAHTYFSSGKACLNHRRSTSSAAPW